MIGIPIAKDGTPRSTAPLVTGFLETKINEAYQLQEWAEDEFLAPEVRYLAQCAVAAVRKKPGSLHMHFLNIESYKKMMDLPPASRPAPPTPEERATVALNQKLSTAYMRLLKAAAKVDDLRKAGDFVAWQGKTDIVASLYAVARKTEALGHYLDPQNTVGMHPDDDQ